MGKKLRLGLNIDHVATVRNARGGTHPHPLKAAQLAVSSGVVDGITAHLREDRRHIRDDDIAELKARISLPLNFEMAATEQMLEIALKTKPHACCLVPEKRLELTTEGGLDVAGHSSMLSDYTAALQEAGIKVSLFVDADETQLMAAKQVGADIVELHTGLYCDSEGKAQAKELKRLQKAAKTASTLGLECHAGHGLTYDTVEAIAAIDELTELNIGHFLIGEALMVGLIPAVTHMRDLMDAARAV